MNTHGAAALHQRKVADGLTFMRKPYAIPLLAVDGCFPLDEGSFLADDLAMIAERFPALKNLSPEEKLILVAELWRDMAARPDLLPPRKDHIRLLKKRLKHYSRNPKDCLPWKKVRHRILASR